MNTQKLFQKPLYVRLLKADTYLYLCDSLAVLLTSRQLTPNFRRRRISTRIQTLHSFGRSTEIEH